ncbi:MAG: serine/threonine protein kinase, partial [Proteobacteria bacterium]|nr:serine/threonine protein kinase [Pseudomonadota bacterium]
MSLGKGYYKILEILGQGAHATVCSAEVRDGSGTRVALKVVRRENLDNLTVINRIHDEARVLGSLRHPNIIHVMPLLDCGGTPVLEMELVEGISLREVLRQTKAGLPTEIALTIIEKSADALDYAYSAPNADGKPMHIIHRDINPSNIVVSTEGTVKLVDFGLVKGNFSGREAKSLYMVSTSQGYAPPERTSGRDSASPLVDVYSLGMTLFELLTTKTMIVSMHPDKHEEGVQRQLAHVNPPNLQPKHLDELRDLIFHMTAYIDKDRPSHKEVVETIGLLMEKASLSAHMLSFAQQIIVPGLDQIEQTQPKNRDFSSIAFLETTPIGVADQELRAKGNKNAPAELMAFLAQSDWDKRQPELQKLVMRCDEFPEASLLAILSGFQRPWWSFWDKPSTSSQVEAALLMLCDHRST